MEVPPAKIPKLEEEISQSTEGEYLEQSEATVKKGDKVSCQLQGASHYPRLTFLFPSDSE